MKNSFQLIGIKPLEGCHEDFRKILLIGQLYIFDQRYNVSYDENNERFDVSFDLEKDNIPLNFYSENLDIQINAVVGGNGSGKSTLAELFLRLLFYYGLKKGKISNNYSSSDTEDNEFELVEKARYKEEIGIMNDYLNVELLYIHNNILYKIALKREEFSIEAYKQESYKFLFEKEIQFEDFTFPFYSMYVNYSHYGLNTNIDGLWLSKLFHKNDGYQLPVVINPYRTKGNIDINVENYLSRDRVFTNVIDTAEESIILPNLKIEYIEIFRDSSKKITKTAKYEKRSRELDFLIRTLFSTFFKDEDYPVTNSYYLAEVEKYLFQKIRTITERYSDYRQFNILFNQNLSYSASEETELKFFFKKIYQDRSHVTLKIRQSLNFLRHDLYQINHEEGFKKFKLHEIIKRINESKEDKFFTETIDYLPPPIFMSRFHFKDKSHFDQLSSGEKQQIYSIHSVIYHLKNIDSVHKSVDEKLRYNSVFLILDEIELYYHPQSQKKTIDRLLYVLEKSKFSNLKHLNIMFLTHSPFILSDIPSECTLKLKKGEILQNEHNQKTFAANITDLLRDSFFLENGLIGDFAKGKIDEVLSFLNYEILINEIDQLQVSLDKSPEKNRRTYRLELAYKKSLIESFRKPRVKAFETEYIIKLIKMIDEPLLRHGLQQLFNKAQPYLN